MHSSGALIRCSTFLPLLCPQIPDASSLPNSSLCCLTSRKLLCQSLGPPPCTVIQKVSVKKKAEVHLICIPSLRYCSPTLPVVQYLNIVASFILSGFLVGYDEEIKMKVKHSDATISEQSLTARLAKNSHIFFKTEVNTLIM